MLFCFQSSTAVWTCIRQTIKLASTGWAPKSTWPQTGGTWLARAYCRRSLSSGTAAGNPELTNALVPSSPSFVVLLGSLEQRKVASDSPLDRGTLGMLRSDRDLQGKAGENGQPGGCLSKSSLQETVCYAGGKLPAGVANDWVTSGCWSSKQQPAD